MPFSDSGAVGRKRRGREKEETKRKRRRRRKEEEKERTKGEQGTCENMKKIHSDIYSCCFIVIILPVQEMSHCWS